MAFQMDTKWQMARVQVMMNTKSNLMAQIKLPRNSFKFSGMCMFKSI